MSLFRTLARFFGDPGPISFGGNARRAKRKPARRREDSDVISGLVNLGYPKKVARAAARDLPGGNLDAKMRAALHRLSKVV